MLSAAIHISRGFPAIQVLHLTHDQRLSSRDPAKTAGDEVLLSAVQNPPRIGETRPIAALLPSVLARYGLNPLETRQSDVPSAPVASQIRTETTIDISV